MTLFSSIEKEAHENTAQKIKIQPADFSGKMQQLRNSFDQFRETVTKVPGIGITKEEQLTTMRSLRQQLIMKKELLMKYKNNPVFSDNSTTTVNNNN